jgi:hypothetical protein
VLDVEDEMSLPSWTNTSDIVINLITLADDISTTIALLSWEILVESLYLGMVLSHCNDKTRAMIRPELDEFPKSECACSGKFARLE